MTEREAFIRAIAENLYDDTPRLAFADWLDEHGEHDRAEFIRVQCELEPMRDKYELPRAAELHEREEELLSKHQKDWLGKIPGEWGWWFGMFIEFRRGFVDFVTTPVRMFLELGAEVRRLHPTIRRVVLFRVNGYGEQLAACSALEGLWELELACWYSFADAQAIARSPHLSKLRILEFWLGIRGYGLPDVRLIRILAASKAWPELRELTLLNPDNSQEQRRKGMVNTANKAAGREIAAYRRGYPDTFPFAPDYWYLFPGYLPDGRIALAAEFHETTPPTLRVLTFDKKGKQMKDVLTVPLPPDLLEIPVEDWFNHKERMQQQLTDVLGFQPGFIRIQDCRFSPGDSYNHPFPDINPDSLGQRDEDTDESWERDPGPAGHGGRVWYEIRNGAYVLGWDRMADKRGHVHST